MTMQHRAQERRNRIVKTAWSGLVAKIVTISVSLLMVPLAVHYLGKEQYGLWVAVSSLVVMLGFMDGGAGNAVINLVAHASGSKNNDLAKIVSTAFFSLMALALFGCLMFLGVFPFVSWGKLLGVSESTSLSDLNTVVLIVGLFFFVSMFTTMVGKIQRGLQEGSLDNFWSGVGAVLSLLFVYVAIRKDAGLIGFVIAFLAGSMLAYLASNIHYLLIRRRELRPKLINVDGAIAKNLFSVGGMFFVLQIVAAIQCQADKVIVANLLGAAAVTNYAICMQLFLLVPVLFSLLMMPLWPAYREAFASGDMRWVKRIFMKSIRWALFISIPAAFILVLLGGKLIELWVGHEIIPSTGLLIGSGIWLVLMTIGSALSVFLNGLQIVKIQLVVSISAGVMNIILTIWFIQMYGVVGAVFGSVVSYLVFTIVPYFFIVQKMLRGRFEEKVTSVTQ